MVAGFRSDQWDCPPANIGIFTGNVRRGSLLLLARGLQLLLKTVVVFKGFLTKGAPGMNKFDDMNVFGPVPSRRLGQSLGVQNVPSGTCSYDCVYCQLGSTSNKTISEKTWYDVESVLEVLIRKEAKVRDLGEKIDYMTFVPNGEPTLDGNLEVESSILSSVGIRTAIITNGSLINQSAVQSALRNFDRVMVKVDAVNETAWRRINRPHEDLHLDDILEGLLRFASIYSGILDTETMLVEKINDDEAELVPLAAFIKKMNPHRAYLSVATRPPSEPWVRTPSESKLAKAYAIFDQQIGGVEYLVHHENITFVSTGDTAKDLLAITEVHPMRKEAVMAYLDRNGGSWDLVEQLVAGQKMAVIPYKGETYYIRKHHPHTVMSAEG
jgi:wyosine [tRNA(Phe)-imidazoG37] synthetase (radical SAM superfamily)